MAWQGRHGMHTWEGVREGKSEVDMGEAGEGIEREAAKRVRGRYGRKAWKRVKEKEGTEGRRHGEA